MPNSSYQSTAYPSTSPDRHMAKVNTVEVPDMPFKAEVPDMPFEAEVTDKAFSASFLSLYVNRETQRSIQATRKLNSISKSTSPDQ